MFTLTQSCSYTQEVKRSRFQADAAPVGDEQAARNFIQGRQLVDASHHCWALRIGQTYRFSDDGEPSGTAGKPILQAIDAALLDNVVVVVTRWFGGVLLGSGGLMRAYGGTAALCLQAAEKTELVNRIALEIDVQFSDLSRVKARLLAVADLCLDDEHFTDNGACLVVAVPQAEQSRVLQMVADLTSGRAVVKEQL